MEKKAIKEFVQEWMNSHEEDTFVKNKHGVVIYSAGHSSLNLTCFFEDLLSDFIDESTELAELNDKYQEVKAENEELIHTVSDLSDLCYDAKTENERLKDDIKSSGLIINSLLWLENYAK